MLRTNTPDGDPDEEIEMSHSDPVCVTEVNECVPVSLVSTKGCAIADPARNEATRMTVQMMFVFMFFSCCD